MADRLDGDGPAEGPLASVWAAAASPASLRALLLGPDCALPVPPASHRDVWRRGDGSADQSTIRSLRQVAERELQRPWPQPTARAYARYFRDGDRSEYEDMVFTRQRRLTRAAVMAATTLDISWVDEVADGVTLLCEQSSWCWPAHDDTWTTHRSVVPTVTAPFLDLGAAEVASQLAWIDQLLGVELDEHVPGIRARVRHETWARVLNPFVERTDWHWLGSGGRVHNWNPWIHGGVLVAALRLVDDQADRARLVAQVIEGLDRYVASLPADGAVDEGHAYWWNGACRALEALDVLAYATGGALDARDVPALRSTVAFPHYMHLGGPWYLNAGDGKARPESDLPWHALHRAAVSFGDEDARRHAAAHRRPGEPVATEREGLGRLLRALTDRQWIEATPSQPPLVQQVWLPSTQVLVARLRAGSAHGLCLAAKGGHNGENHNHNDVGSVVVALNGVPVVVDAGRPTYTAQTFGSDRYQIWTMQSSWHSVPEIRGTPQSAGEQFTARDVVASFDDAAASLRMDLAAAYPRHDVRHWWRTARLDRATHEVSITDKWQLEPCDDAHLAPGTQRSQVHFLLAGQVRLTGHGHAVVQAVDGAGEVAISWCPATAAPSLAVRNLDDPMLSDVWGTHLTRLSLDVGDASLGTITVTFMEA